jgi:hypothetical protein
MPTEYLEHANVTVRRLDAAVQFLQTALPTWRVRGEGRMDWFGKPIHWLHIGNDLHYIALQGGGVGDGLHWQSHAVGVKHLGIVVPDLAALQARLQAAGHLPDHPGGRHPHRQSLYYQADELVQIEFMQYLSDDAAERNDYRT